MLNRRFSRTERESATADEERLRPCTCLLLTGDRLPSLDRGDTSRSLGGEIWYVSPELLRVYIQLGRPSSPKRRDLERRGILVHANREGFWLARVRVCIL